MHYAAPMLGNTPIFRYDAIPINQPITTFYCYYVSTSGFNPLRGGCETSTVKLEALFEEGIMKAKSLNDDACVEEVSFSY